MVGSSENLSVQDQMVHSSLLPIKQYQNLLINLESCKYDPFMLPIIECLKYSPLTIALTHMENVSISLLSKAYSSTNYVKEEQKITFELHNHTTSITKTRLCMLLGLPQTDDMIKPETIPNVALLEMFYQMGYKETLTIVSKFKKPNIPPQWNGLFTFLFKSFSERVTRSDCASKMFMALMYNLYTSLNVDYGAILWAQVI